MSRPGRIYVVISNVSAMIRSTCEVAQRWLFLSFVLNIFPEAEWYICQNGGNGVNVPVSFRCLSPGVESRTKGMNLRVLSRK